MDLTPEKQAEKNTLTRQLKKNRNRKKIIILGSVALVAASAFIVTMTGIGIPKIKASDTTVLARANIEKSISASGTVETSNAYKVYNTLNYPVEEIYAEVGQVVQKGDKLCQLDNDSLKKQIELKETTIGMSAEQAALLVKASEEKYNAAKAALANGTNSSIVSGNNAVNVAYYAWQKAKKGYDDYLTFLNSGDNSQILLQKAAVDNAAGFLQNARFVYDETQSDLSSAKRTLDQARRKIEEAKDDLDSANDAVASAFQEYTEAEKAYNDAKVVVDAAGASATQEQIDAVNAAKSNMDMAQVTLTNAKAAAAQAQLEYDTAKVQYDAEKKSYDSYSYAEQQAKIALDNAQTAYDNANAQYQAAIKASNSTLADYELAVKSSYQSYQDALSALNSSKTYANNELQAYKDNLNSAQASAKNDAAVKDLSNLKKDLDSTTVTSPASGTVTAVYVRKGSVPLLMFVIEGTDHLVVDTSVKENDINKVKTGMAVVIRSDATGDTLYDGKVTSIAPSPDKNQSGDTITDGDIGYDTKVQVISESTGLHIGMSVNLDYILQTQNDVLAVPYEAVYKNEQGEQSVLADVKQWNGKHVLKEYPVVTGIDNEAAIVISGDNIYEGMRVINEPAKYKSGAIVSIE